MKPSSMTHRLEDVFSIIPKAHVIADIGTDHGYLAVELIRRGRARRVIAGDVHKGPLAGAVAYVQACGLEGQVECRLGDGLTIARVGELNGAVICGMGGYLMRDILKAGPERLDFYVLQPQNGQGDLRRYLVANGYCIVKDIIMRDMGKMYQAFLAIRRELLGNLLEEDNPLSISHISGVSLQENPYEHLEESSILWEAGALAQSEPLWKDHITYLIYQRECALRGMGLALADTLKYQSLLAEVASLRACL